MRPCGPPTSTAGSSLGFTEYGRLRDFVAVGERRYDKVFYMLDFRDKADPRS